MPRRQLPVASPIAMRSLGLALGRLLLSSGDQHARVVERVRARYGADDAVLTDSGTSALVLALRLLAGRAGVVALPAYACIDLTAAARFAGVRVRLYDVDPATLSPDLDSLDQAIRRGVDAVVVAHLYGYPADMRGVVELTSRHDVPLIEDAAQGAGGTFDGMTLGSFGAMSVLSFGRGKGTCGGGGGALLARLPRHAQPVRAADAALGDAPSGALDLAKLFAQVVLGRPSVYALPSRVPGLRLGEMVYHPAHEPRRLSRSAATVVQSALAMEASAVQGRRAVAAALVAALDETPDLVPVQSVRGGVPGYLRLAVRDVLGTHRPAPDLGVLRSYPMTLAEHSQLRTQLLAGEDHNPGASELVRTLLTLPTHHFVAQRDIEAVRGWMTEAWRGSEREFLAHAR